MDIRPHYLIYCNSCLFKWNPKIKTDTFSGILRKCGMEYVQYEYTFINRCCVDEMFSIKMHFYHLNLNSYHFSLDLFTIEVTLNESWQKFEHSVLSSWLFVCLFICCCFKFEPLAMRGKVWTLNFSCLLLLSGSQYETISRTNKSNCT